MAIMNTETQCSEHREPSGTEEEKLSPCIGFKFLLSSMHLPGAVKPLMDIVDLNRSPRHSQHMESSSCPARMEPGVTFCHTEKYLERCSGLQGHAIGRWV